MAAVTIQNYTNTELKVTQFSVEYILKKAYTTAYIDGTDIILKYHLYELNNGRTMLTIAYADVISPASANIAALLVLINGYLNDYGSSGGGLSFAQVYSLATLEL